MLYDYFLIFKKMAFLAVFSKIAISQPIHIQNLLNWSHKNQHYIFYKIDPKKSKIWEGVRICLGANSNIFAKKISELTKYIFELF